MEYEKLNALFNVLNEETRIYEEILKLSREKKDIVIEGKVAELEKITKIEQSLVVNLGKLETLREKCVEEIADQLNIKPSELTITELSKHLNEENSKKLIECKTKLENILKELKEINQLNSKLIKNSLDYIDFSLNILSAASETNNNYNNDGEVSGGSKRTFMDIKL
ncbi:MAG TPA: flagellar protein FlgN [Ruminiclostridium sp.]|uniref:Flagellar biosynthesis protein FlgN n=1 Tax=Acetivibrio saccincola TaxID=1677857 RepID=A0A2K9E1J9_9FIRM|nr:flagellar protein FlgN [Acetivibrio saccincola]AUG56248.1 FlgN protein [Acetivibrio saccincola]NLW26094.1 flagellar protein FlgN [Acetivibrio saccincola]PQQ65568.1 flagellar biosynthesis protein FlgN [Acetivibrio saccincola]HAA43421.1 flagellar protein FlgN [Ruminiclostridium sp.]